MVKNKNILVLGSSGFLGNHLVKSLYEDNEVTQLDIHYPQNEYKGTNFIKGSILDKSLVLKAMKNIDIVYHFAALTDLDNVNNNPAPAIEINIAGTSNVLDACVEAKVERLIFSSSVYVYSNAGGVYKSTKQACELLIKDYDKMYDINYTIMQLGSVYGPNANQTNLISRLIVEGMNNGKMEHFGKGDELRKYIFVHDVIKASIDLINNRFNKQKVILIGNKSISICELMDQIISLLGSDIKKIFYNKDYNIHYRLSPFDIDIDGAINYESDSFTNLEDGLIQTIDSIQN